MELHRSRISKGKDVQYFAYARNEKNQIAQLFIERLCDVKSEFWTGKIYKSEAQAARDMVTLNCSKRGV